MLLTTNNPITQKHLNTLLENVTDLNARDINHVSKLIYENLPFEQLNPLPMHSWRATETVIAAAYLYSKCPGNSDKVIDYRHTIARMKLIQTKMNMTRGIKKVKEMGFIPQYCIVTSTLILRNLKHDTVEECFMPIFDKAIEYSETEIIRKKRQGKSPTTVAAACFYMASIVVDLKFTQERVSAMFGVSTLAVRNRYKDIVEDLAPEIIGPRPRFQCRNCIYISPKLPERKTFAQRYAHIWDDPNPGYRLPRWKCLGNGSVRHIMSSTRKRICKQYKPNNKNIRKGREHL